MTTALFSSPHRRSCEPASFAARHLIRAASLLLALAGCSERGILEPTSANVSGHSQPATPAHASVVVTPSYSTFDTRTEFAAAGVVDKLNAFDEFTGQPVHEFLGPWTSNGVTYTSEPNYILEPGIGLGVTSNGVSTEYGTPLTGTFAPTDGITLFGADLLLLVAKAPVGLVLSTNLATYTFANLDVPLATNGRRFVGVALAKPNEYLTGFRFTVGASSALLLDNVAIGHTGVPNASPHASVGGPYTGLEGSSVPLALTATDADDDALTYAWDLGDGTKGTGPTPPASHVYANNGSFDIMLAVADGRGGVDTARTTAAVANVAPVLGTLSVPTTPLALTTGGATLPVSAPFTDAGILDAHTSTLDCGIGAVTQSDAPNGTAGGACTFTSPGVYAIQLTVRDEDGGTDTRLASGQVVVYDAGAGWVTGGGWIVSPAGAFAAAPALTGKLTFGFVARYQASTAPDGNAEFKLNLGKLDFRSTALDWLVASASTARLQGRGTLNGTGEYAFEVLAIDGTPGDAVRIRIWNRATGVVVYDNQRDEPLDSNAATPLAGGSVQLHQR
jgi:PKD repeat protein